MRIDISGTGLESLDFNAGYGALDRLLQKSGRGSEFTGWTGLPAAVNGEEYARIKACARRIREDADVLVVVGIGGSYLGARAAIELLKSPRHNSVDKPQVYFLGNGIAGEDVLQVLRLTQGKKTYLNVISKSGTTLEPALAFRVLREKLEKELGREEAAKRIVCTTDKARGALRTLALEEGYECFVIPDDVGGRYSVLSPVGLLPMAAAGIDIDAVMKGAALASDQFTVKDISNPALIYALSRQQLYRQGKTVEVMSYPGEAMRFMAEWWKQLFGESEGKELGGIFPASCQLTADLHSLGQYIQEGSRILMESIVRFDTDREELTVPIDGRDLDGLNYTAGKSYAEIFKAAAEGVRQAHIAGGVPVMELVFERADEKTFGEMVIFYEIACAVSAYVQDVNPFDQPGVEAYKKNMFRLLGKK